MRSLSRRCSRALPVALLASLLCLATARGAEPDPPPLPPSPISAEEAQQLAQYIRALTTEPAGDYALPQALRKPLQLPLVVALYSDVAPLQRVSTKPTLATAAADIASQLRAFLTEANLPTLLEKARMEIVLPTRMEQAILKDRAGVLAGLEPGLAGLVCDLGERKVTFTPLTLLIHSQGLDTLNEAFIAQESVEAPRRVNAQPFYAAEFIEREPRGEMVPLYRGNVLLPPPTPTEMVEAIAAGGMWLLRTQQEDGSFLTGYMPTLDKTLPEYDLGGHLRATIALLLLDQLFQKEELARAHTKALDYAMAGDRLKREEGTALLYLPLPSDDVSGSALLLTALSIKALRAERPGTTATMRGLGEYLCTMTASNGRLYASLKGARQGKPPHIVRGGIYADALIALTLLQRVSPTDRVGETSKRLADALVAETEDVQIRSDQRTLGRVVEALAEYYKLSRQEVYADKALQLCAALQRIQVAARGAEYPDCAGGFPDKGGAPYTFSSASAACGLAAAYEAALLSHRPRAQFYEPVRAAATFLMNMQYRSENSFYLRRPLMAQGAFRRSPTDLNIYCGAAAEALRALMNATTVTVETGPLEPAEEPAR